MFKSKIWAVLAVLVAVAFPFSKAHSQQWLGAYKPSLGTLPTEQGWSLVETGSQPTPLVSDGILHQGITLEKGVQYWTRQGLVSDFTSSKGLVFEVVVKVISSTYVEIPSLDTWQPGYMVNLIDVNGNQATLGITDTGVRVGWNNLLSNYSAAFIPWDTTSAYSAYRLTVASSKISLSINGKQVVTGLALGGSPSTNHDKWYFGDTSEYGTSETQLKAIHWGVLPDITGCIKMKSTAIKKTKVLARQQGEADQITVTDGKGCYEFSNIVSGKTFQVIINGPLVP